MTGITTISIYDDINNCNAEGIKYDLWRINSNTDRVHIKHDVMKKEYPHVLIHTNGVDDLGSFEIIIYAKDYLDDFPENRLIIPFGVNELNRDQHLSIHINQSGFTCTL